MIGNYDADAEEAWKHLAPGGPWFHVLIHNGGVSREIDGRLLDRFYGERPETGVVAVEFESQFSVPVQVANLAGFEPH